MRKYTKLFFIVVFTVSFIWAEEKSAKKINISSKYALSYKYAPFGKANSMFADFNYDLLKKENFGKAGIKTSIGYNSFETEKAEKYIKSVPLNVGVYYQLDLKPEQIVLPYLSIGIGYPVILKNDDNNQKASLYSWLELGITLNLLHKISDDIIEKLDKKVGINNICLEIGFRTPLQDLTNSILNNLTNFFISISVNI